jgi:hypothetical protein
MLRQGGLPVIETEIPQYEELLLFKDLRDTGGEDEEAECV